MRKMYSERQVKELASGVIDESIESGAIKTELDKKADLTGANFVGDVSIGGDLEVSGDITGDSIIENMSGYSFQLTEENPELTIIYAGVVKNGNKITFVIFGKYNRPAEDPAVNPSLGKFIVPLEVASKIHPWSSNFVDSKNVPFFASASSISNKVVGTEKKTSTSIQFTAYGTHTLTANTDYMFRVEETFLLSNSLAE